MGSASATNPHRAWVGTSGYQYKPWRGVFYPPACREPDMLAYYAERLSTVEINSTFYRMPRAEVLQAWRSKVPAGFVFAVKASQRITHRKRLIDCGEPLGYLLTALGALGDHCGPVLLQLPPNMRRHDERLSAFLSLLPTQPRFAFEFRHDSWLDETVFGLLREAGVALVLTDSDEQPAPAAWPQTADFGYVRLRREAYGPGDLAAWADRLRATAAAQTFVYLKHEETAPGTALSLQACLGAPQPAAGPR